MKTMAAYLQKFATWIGWGALGAIIGLVALLLTLDFKKTAVTVFLLSDTNLVDVKSPLNELQVLYNGEDLIKENLGLHLYRVQIQNTGNNVILKEHFDENDLWGIRVSSGSIVKISNRPVTLHIYNGISQFVNLINRLCGLHR